MCLEIKKNTLNETLSKTFEQLDIIEGIMKILKKLFFIATAIFSVSAMAQDKIITKDGNVFHGWNVEISERYIFYNTDKNDDATIKRIEKDNVLIVKRQDGSTVNLYEEESPTPVQDQDTPESATSEQVILKASDLTGSAKNENEALINNINCQPSFVPENESDLKKEAKEVWCAMGVKKNSVLTDGNVRIGVVVGFFDKENKKAPAIFSEGIPFYGFNTALSVFLENLSDKTVYIDLGKSFFVRMGRSYCYYTPSSTTTSSSSSSGAGINLGSVAGALGVGGVVGTLANGVNVGGGSNSGISNTTYSQRVISVPPKAIINLDAQYLFGNEAYDICQGLRYGFTFTNYTYYFSPYFKFPKKSAEGPLMNGTHYKYSEENSPFNVSTIIAYSFSEDCNNEIVLTADLYLKDIFGRYTSWTGDYKGNLNSTNNAIIFKGKLDDSKGLGFPRK